MDNLEPHRPTAFAQPVTRVSLVKLDMSELEQLGFRGGQRIEVREPKSDDWRKGTVEKMVLDGRAKIRFDDEPQHTTPHTLRIVPDASGSFERLKKKRRIDLVYRILKFLN